MDLIFSFLDQQVFIFSEKKFLESIIRTEKFKRFKRN